MSLTLDEVRNIKFRMAKRSGYEVLDVDEFVDRVEEGFAALQEENENLKRQVSSLQSSAPAEDDHHEDRDDHRDQQPETQAQPAPQPVSQPAPAAATGPAETIVVTTSKEASSAVVRLVEMSTDQAEKLVGEAEEEAKRIRDEANRSAHQVTTDARTRAERIESEARVNADRLRSESQSRADQLDADTETRRHQMFGDLETQRDQLTSAVADLRRFESQYRENLTSHLKRQIDAVSSHSAEPEESPSLLDGSSEHGSNDGSDHEQQPVGRRERSDGTENGGSAQSDTPRLDALLGDQH